MAVKMELTPIKREFARTSTPAYCYDSGYFGSSIKSLRYSLCDSSPSSKISPQKFNDAYSYHNDLTHPSLNLHFLDNESSHPNVKKQLEFEDSVFENDISVCELKPIPFVSNHFTPDKVYYSLGLIPPSAYFARPPRSKVDFLASLKERNCERIISDVLSYIPPEDLCKMQCVSKRWKELVERDALASRRRKEYLKNLKLDRENRKQRLPLEAQKRYTNLSVFPRFILHDINNNKVDFEPTPKKDVNTRFNSFIKEGKNYKRGMLMKCPRCNFASKELHGDKYRCTECDFVFCKKCFSPFRSCQCCPMLNEVPNLLIGSKRCKKNLKRL